MHMHRPMRIAVTGGLGRLGSYVMRALLPEHDAVAIDRIAGDGTLPAVAADLRDEAALRCAFAGADVVIHIGGIDRSAGAPDQETLETNVLGTWNVFTASQAVGVRRVVLCSSSAVTGLDHSNPDMPPLYLPIDEDHPLRPKDAYGVSKRTGETIAEAFARDGAMEVLALRPVFIAFPAMQNFMAGRGAGEEGRAEPMPFLRAYISPEDCAQAFLLAATMPAYAGYDAMFIAADDSFAEEPTVPRMSAIYGAQLSVRQPGRYADDPMASSIDSSRARRILGWRPTTRWADGAVTASAGSGQ
jgi:UDP-glucose 4-epimerase